MSNFEILTAYWESTDIDSDKISIKQDGDFLYKGAKIAKYEIEAGFLSWVKPGTLSMNKDDQSDLKAGFSHTKTLGSYQETSGDF